MTNDNAATKFLVQDLDLYYGKFQALKKINLDIKEKEITALIGPSGCGKSTFLKTLNRMNDLEEGVRIEGSIALDGKDIFAEIDPISLRHRVGMVFQQPNPFPKSIYDNVASAYSWRDEKERAGRDCGAQSASGCHLGRAEGQTE